MHIIVAMYLVMWATLLQTALDADLVSVRVYQPLVTSVVYVITATLHLYAVYSVVVSECKQRPLSQKVGPSIGAIAPQTRIAFFDLDNWYDHSIILFNLIEIACASTQATTMFRTIVEPAKVVSYAIVVVLYIVLSPLILFVRNTQAKTSLVNVADSILSFTLSCGHPFAAVVFQLSDYVLVHPALEHDNLWSTQTLVLTRQLLPSTFVHLCSILGLHVGTYLALRRVMNTSHHIHLALTAVTEKKPPVAPVTRTRTARVKQTLHLLVHASRSSLQDQLKLSRKKRLLLRVNLVVNMTLGMASILVITRSMVRRTHCPEYCRAYSRPLFDLSCHCAYVEVNCVLQGIVDPLPLLDPAIILWISMAAVAILGSVVGIGLSKHMPPYMDNLGLRRTYQRTYRTSIFFVLVSLLHGGLEWILSVPLGREFHVRNLIYTLAMQYVFFFNIAAPLRHLALSSQAMTSVVTTTSKAASRMKELEQYLRSNHGLPTFMTFCQRDFRTEELRAWQLVEQFKQRLVSARKLLTTCLVPQCALACPTSVKWGPTYVARLESWLRRDEDIVGNELPTTFFDEFQAALLEALCEDVWLRFQRQSLDWIDHDRRRRSLEGMDTVLRMVVKQQPAFPLPFPVAPAESKQTSTTVVQVFR
ncbi:hypothetical protein DYB37_008502 [Aphanomyces astaci]|uniref:RGS domain-containing protein n=2 Tax=Aphanomyces astaci TaxID=112090 RepID=A0A397CHZ4_APHAT|nr:hypothetical protein DYB38_011015 [Aphanomyces astaci]RHY98132.1 hypothetical protein DYB35_010423 [Aphanomyces astaci]RHZ16356.1 hypothetical protein DYB37_008502 [Aphanomyces astaci]